MKRKRNTLRLKNAPNIHSRTTKILLLNIVVIFFLHATSYGSIAFIFSFLYLMTTEMQKRMVIFKTIIFLVLSLIADISAGLNIGYVASILLLSYFFIQRLFKVFNLATYFLSQGLAFLIINFACFSVDLAYIKWFFIVEFNLILFLIIYIRNIIKRNHL